jgi:thiazole synthase
MVGSVAMTSPYMAAIPAAQRQHMVYDDTFSITVNGQHRRVTKGLTIADLALELGLEPTKVAVERNMEIVPRSTLGETRIEDGDDFEIVTFVGGG